MKNYELIEKYALSQLDYPQGIGIKKSVKIKNRIVGLQPLTEIPTKKLTNLIKELRNEWIRMGNGSFGNEKDAKQTKKNRL